MAGNVPLTLHDVEMFEGILRVSVGSMRGDTRTLACILSACSMWFQRETVVPVWDISAFDQQCAVFSCLS